MGVKKRAKSLWIDLTDGNRRPVYDFKGEWSGADVRVVISTLYRSYQLHKRQERRNGISEKGERDGSGQEAARQVPKKEVQSSSDKEVQNALSSPLPEL